MQRSLASSVRASHSTAGSTTAYRLLCLSCFGQYSLALASRRWALCFPRTRLFRNGRWALLRSLSRWLIGVRVDRHFCLPAVSAVLRIERLSTASTGYVL